VQVQIRPWAETAPGRLVSLPVSLLVIEWLEIVDVGVTHGKWRAQGNKPEYIGVDLAITRQQCQWIGLLGLVKLIPGDVVQQFDTAAQTPIAPVC
jgi:hypothetical protein